MGRTEIQVKIFGENETREYTSLVDNGVAYTALPMEEIEAPGLRWG